MASEHQTLRLQPALLARAEALVPLLADDTRHAGLGNVTRSTVLRVALARGLDALEAEYGMAPRRKPLRPSGGASNRRKEPQAE